MALQHKPFQEMIVKGWLGEENVENLKWYARLLGADRKIIRKPELVDLIAAHLNGGLDLMTFNKLPPMRKP